MISSVNDYKYVTGADIDADHPHGDLDRIIIDGDIMPLRTGTTSTGVDRAKILRGEDVVFLQEAMCRCDKNATFLDFSRVLNGRDNDRSNDWRYDIAGIMSGLAGTGCLVRPGSTDLGDVIWDDGSAVFSSLDFVTTDDLALPSFEPSFSHKLDKSVIDALFNALKFMICPDTPWCPASVANAETYSDVESLDPEYPFSPPNKYHLYSYNVYSGSAIDDDHPRAGGGSCWFRSSSPITIYVAGGKSGYYSDNCYFRSADAVGCRCRYYKSFSLTYSIDGSEAVTKWMTRKVFDSVLGSDLTPVIDGGVIEGYFNEMVSHYLGSLPGIPGREETWSYVSMDHRPYGLLILDDFGKDTFKWWTGD